MSTSGITAVGTALQVTYPVLVNGFECFDASGIKVARDYQNPNTLSQPVKNGFLIAPVTPTGSVEANQPLSSGPRGTVVNIVIH